jgi:hypothetical protein
VLFTIGNTTNIYEDRLECAALNISPTSKVPGNGTAATAAASTSTAVVCTNPSNVEWGRIPLGVGLGFPLLVSLAMLYFEHTKRVKAETQLEADAPRYYEAMNEQAKMVPTVSNPTELHGQDAMQELPIVPIELGHDIVQELPIKQP